MPGRCFRNARSHHRGGDGGSAGASAGDLRHGTLHCLDGDETLRLTMPMPDALLLLNSLRAIEEEFELQGWAEQIGCSAMAMEEVAAELAQFSETCRARALR